VAKLPEFPSERIVRELSAQILSGELRPGDQLPTVANLCDHYHVSRVTVLKALDQLRTAALITTVARWGSFVADGSES
jgi:DNA-binding GntR family transcriptional regulator